jgi:hypothetical protein
MHPSRPFFPDDKPRTWVLGVSAGLLGLFVGFIAFTAAWFELQALKSALLALFAACWATFAISWLIFVARLVSGQYTNVQPRPWREQVW